MSVTRQGHVLAQPWSMKRWLLFNGLAIVAGMLGGLGAVVLRFVILGFSWFFQNVLLPIASFEIAGINIGFIIIPVSGAIGYAWLTKRPDVRGSGMPEIIYAAALDRGRIAARIAPAKLVASALTIASGGSAGREGPTAVIGATLSSLFSRALKLKPFETRILMACGIAGAVGGTFNAPFGGALFSLEVIFHGVGIFSIIPVFLSSAMGSIVVSAVFGSQVAFPIATVWPYMDFGTYFVFAAIGCILGLVSFGWVKLMYLFQKLYNKIKLNHMVKAITGAAITGIIIAILPGMGITGTGYDGVLKVLENAFPAWLLLLLALSKMVATANTLASGGSGGVFGPSLYIGALWGGFIGTFVQPLIPGIGVELYALAGMGAVFAGAAQAPIHIIVMVAELTRNFSVIPPLLVTCATSFAISWMLLRGSSIYTAKLEARGIKIGIESFFLLQNIAVEKIMTPDPVSVELGGKMDAVAKVTSKEKYQAIPVIEGGKFAGLITRDEYSRVLIDKGALIKPLKDFMIPAGSCFVMHENDMVQDAMDEMVERGIHLVVILDSRQRGKVVGIVTEGDVRRTFEKVH